MQSRSEHLERILVELKDQWEQLALALAEFLPIVTAGRSGQDTAGLDPHTEAPFYDLLWQALVDHHVEMTPARDGPLRAAVVDVVTQVKADLRLVGFWDNPPEREQLRRRIIHRLDETRLEDGSDLFDYDWLPPIADQLAKANHHRLAGQP